jgi:hypothetical protein
MGRGEWRSASEPGLLGPRRTRINLDQPARYLLPPASRSPGRAAAASLASEGRFASAGGFKIEHTIGSRGPAGGGMVLGMSHDAASLALDARGPSMNRPLPHVAASGVRQASSRGLQRSPSAAELSRYEASQGHAAERTATTTRRPHGWSHPKRGGAPGGWIGAAVPLRTGNRMPGVVYPALVPRAHRGAPHPGLYKVLE